MSQVLVASPTSPPMTITFKTPTQHLPSPTQAVEEVPPEERILVSQLSHLASQHHTSEYNKLKFGPGGCSTAYVPLSICAPQHVRWIVARQLQTLNRQAWWPVEHTHTPNAQNSADASTTAPCAAEETRRIANHSDAYQEYQEYEVLETSPPDRPLPSLNHPLTVNLQEELSVAISSPLSIIDITPAEQLNLLFTTKTSKSHPINISHIVPVELLPLIASHLVPASPHVSYMFNLPPSLLLNYLVSQPLPPDTLRSYPLMRVQTTNSQLPTNGPGPPDSYHRPIPFYGTSQLTAQSFGNTLSLDTTSPSPMEQVFLPTDPHLREASLEAYPIQERPHSAPPSLAPMTQHKSILEGLTISPPALKELISAMSSNIMKVPGKQLGKTSVGSDFRERSPTNLGPASLPTLGNILLSSCPGKKVRLNGPVRGRGAICRDLEQDMRRIKSLGVGCVICCLDDDELEYLGASWSKYCSTAHSLGLDVIRIPMPEGFAPISPVLLNQQLSYVIQSYTLKGISILVHCRGGVGRAGLVACCWLLKLGLCGWISDPDDQSSAYENGKIVKVRKDTLMMVERAISVVRRRRSVKAIETYEQVKFLVEFVEFMRLSKSRV